jgi:hypothetical protein
MDYKRSVGGSMLLLDFIGAKQRNTGKESEKTETRLITIILNNNQFYPSVK